MNGISFGIVEFLKNKFKFFCFGLLFWNWLFDCFEDFGIDWFRVVDGFFV